VNVGCVVQALSFISSRDHTRLLPATSLIRQVVLCAVGAARRGGHLPPFIGVPVLNVLACSLLAPAGLHSGLESTSTIQEG
jgi:hypothetical protein